MDVDLIKYFAAEFFARDSWSQQCVSVRDCFHSGSPGKESIEKVLKILSQHSEIETDTVDFLKKAIAPQIGHEGAILKIGIESEVEFWQKVSTMFPSNGILLAAYAETLYLARKTEEACLCLLKAFKLYPENLVSLESSLYEIFVDTDCEKDYIRIDLTVGLANEIYSVEDIVGDMSWIQERFQDDEAFLTEIDEILKKYT